MKISCQACGTKYTIADDKVRGRKVRVRCKSCSTPIVVDTAQAESEAPPPETAAAAPAADPWTVNLSDTEQRPMTTEEIVSGYHMGTVTTDAFVWKEGMEDWIPLLEQPELRAAIEAGGAAQAPAPAQPQPAPAPAFPAPSAQAAYAADPPWTAPAAAAAPAPTPAPAPAVAAAAPARIAGGRSHGAADLFGGVASAGSEEESIKQAVLPGSTAYDAKVTGARNENSVLFSLDSLKAGFAAPKPAASPGAKPGAPPPKRPGARPGMQSAPDDPFGMSSGNSGVARLGGGGNPLFSFGDNQALMMAPPPPPEPPPPPVVTDPVGVEYAAAQPAKKGPDKRIFIFGGAAVAVLVIVIGIAVAFSGGKKKDEAVAQNDTSSEKSDKESSKEGKSDESKSEKSEKTAEAKPDENKAEPAATAAPSASAEKKPPTEEEKKRFAESQKKEQEKKEAEKAGEKKTEPPPPTDGPAFNKGAAIAALSSAASASSGCKRPGGPTGSGKALVTFAPSGRVTSANVTGGSFGGTSVGGCVASVFRRAKVPPFGGGPVTVSKSFTIAP